MISTSIRYLDTAQKNSSLPENVEVLPGQDGLANDGFGSATPKHPGEGTAMLEIVHRIAPDATLAFATSLGGEIVMAKNIQDLVRAWCNIMVDDMTYFEEPPFQDGMIAQQVNAATAQGVLYVSSAGNFAQLDFFGLSANVWEGDFVALPNGLPYQQFPNFPGQDPAKNILLAIPQELTISWNASPQIGLITDEVSM